MIQNIDFQYQNLLRKILNEGVRKENRTGIDTLAIAGAMIEHDMSEGFPLLTTKKVYFNGVKVELEGFIKAITSKRWYQERGCNIWSDWANPKKVPYGNTEEAKLRMKNEDDLGVIYGAQWRDFKRPNTFKQEEKLVWINGGYQPCIEFVPAQGIDQLKNIVDTLKKNPHDRRMICSAWNPAALGEQALPPCHYVFQVTVLDNKVNLFFNMRSWDALLGAPFNLASYGLLLHLLTLEVNKYRKENNLPLFNEGKLICFAADVHLYENHLQQAREQLSRKPYALPQINTDKFTSIFDWEASDSKIINYISHPAIKAEVAV